MAQIFLSYIMREVSYIIVLHERRSKFTTLMWQKASRWDNLFKLIMICSFDPAIRVCLAVAHHLELFAAKKKMGRFSHTRRMLRSEKQRAGICVCVWRWDEGGLQTEAIFTESHPVRAHHMAFIHLTNDMKNNKCSLFTIVGPSGGNLNYKKLSEKQTQVTPMSSSRKPMSWAGDAFARRWRIERDKRGSLISSRI